ncbi:hypothetical protein BASA83_012557 [Batrachochytrium salamandrivorans]|nr:hypothetical protein BASA83_012557 [Batrachochytrium salamandrivorans]
MANSDISVPSVDHRQNHQHLPHLDIRPCSRLNHIPRSILAPILGHQMEHVSKIDRRHKIRCSIPHKVPEDRQRNIIQRLERQSKQTHWRIGKTTDIASRPASTNNPTSTTITADPRSHVETSATNVLLFAT